MFSFFPAEVEEVVFPFQLPPTILPNRGGCDPSYTIDARNEVNMNVQNILTISNYLGNRMTEK